MFFLLRRRRTEFLSEVPGDFRLPIIVVAREWADDFVRWLLLLEQWRRTRNRESQLVSR